MVSDTEMPTHLAFAEESTVLSNSAVFETDGLHAGTSTAVVGPSVQAVADTTNERDRMSSVLNERQRMAHGIVVNHLRAYLRGSNPAQCLMIVHGQGGTGKSTLLNEIARTFKTLQASSLLAKTAMSGVAAWIVRAGLNLVKASTPFGGLNIILLGDFHQFPPVVNNSKELYNSSLPKNNCQIGRHLYEQLSTVIKLEEHMHVHDPEWNESLQRSQTGDCTKDDILAIRKLVLSNPDCDVPDFTCPPWDETILITPCNGVCTRWNQIWLSEHC